MVKTPLKKFLILNGREIFEKVFDDSEDFFEKVFDNGEDIFEKVVNDEEDLTHDNLAIL